MAKQQRSRPIITSAAEVLRIMKVTLQKIAAGPGGVALSGTVLDVPEEQGKDMIKRQTARAYDQQRDANARRGWTKAGEQNE